MRELHKEVDPKTKVKPFFLFLMPIFVFLMTDSMLVFLFPIIANEFIDSTLTIGLILAASSAVGVVCDLIFPWLLQDRSWRFELIAGILIGLVCPLLIMLSQYYMPVVLLLIVSMTWGVYFELLMFSEANYISEEEKSEDFTSDWSALLSITYMSSLIAPLLASYFWERNLNDAMIILVGFQLLAFIFAVIAVKKNPPKNGVKRKSKVAQAFSLLKEFKSWGVLSERVAPILILRFTAEFVEASFWTIGGLFGLSLVSHGVFPWLPMVLFLGPLILGSFSLSRVKIKSHKKRISQIALLIGGTALLPLYVYNGSEVFILIFIFLAGVGFAIAKPLNFAIMSKLLKRIKKNKEDLIGLHSAMASLAYIVAPIVVGFLVDLIGFQFTFASVGFLAIFVAVFLFMITPKRILMPQKNLEKLNGS